MKYILILLLSGCATIQTVTHTQYDHPPSPELVGRDLQAIQAGMDRAMMPWPVAGQREESDPGMYIQ
jgi:hypothetical protein